MTRWIAGIFLIAGTLVFSACARGVQPAELDTANTACRYCRMAVSDVHFAAQIVAPGVEPQFFDDLGCLQNYLQDSATKLPARAVVFVADHRTGAWVRATDAIFTRTAAVPTPMGGGMIAHVDAASRTQDPSAVGGTLVKPSEILGAAASKGPRP